MHPDRLCPMPEVSAGLHLFLRHIQTLPYRFISVASCRLGLLHIGFVPVFPGLDLFARLAASRLPPHIATPSHQAFRSSSRRHCWSNVEVEDGFASGLRGSGVVVDHVSNLLLDSICFSDNVPIVAIKGRFRPAREETLVHGLKHDSESAPRDATYPNFDGYSQPII